tara:strand:+ start:8084 stop:8395 length:312 start_codon:yes stop_codon:yes gene_type:complete
MRKVDSEMLTAIRHGNNFSKGNRNVSFNDGVVEVRFHGHLICKIEGHRVSINNCGYWTNTTKQILNEILVDWLGYNLFQRKFDWFVSTPTGEVEYTGDWLALA